MTPATNHEHDPRGASVTPYDRLTAALPESHDGPIGVIDSADLRAVLKEAATLRGIVRDLASRDPLVEDPASKPWCRLCGRSSGHGESCPWSRAAALEGE